MSDIVGAYVGNVASRHNEVEDLVGVERTGGRWGANRGACTSRFA